MFYFNHHELELICRDKDLRTQELHKVNDFYGQAAILKKYLGWNRPFKLIFEHGIPLDSQIWEVDFYSNFSIALVCSGYRKEVYKKRKGFVFDIGAGYLYAIKVFERDYTKEIIERKGMVVFPSHSSHHATYISNEDYYIKRLKNIPEHIGPITICIYWKDYLLGRHNKYFEAGFDVISVGHMYDEDFMLRFHDICRHFKYAASEDLGSHYFYSKASGCKFYFINTEGQRGIQKRQLHYDNSEFESLMEKVDKITVEDNFSSEVDEVLAPYINNIPLTKSALMQVIWFSEIVFLMKNLKGMFYSNCRSILFVIKKILSKILGSKIKHHYKMFRHPSYRIEIEKKLEIERIASIKRYQIGETNLLEHKLKFVDSASFRFIYDEIFEKEVYKFSASDDSPLIIDAGANIGLSVIYFKQLYPNSKIIAFEPDEDVFSVLKSNIISFQYENVELIKKALWKEECTLSFAAEGADGGRVDVNSSSKDMVKISAVRLSAFLREPVDFLKIDIEGSELEVLTECAEKLVNVSKMFVEYHSFEHKEQNLSSLISIIENAGFRYLINSPGLSSTQPFINQNSYLGMDMQLNIYAYR